MAKFVIRSTSAGSAVRGSGKRVEEKRELGGYQRLEIHGPFEVELAPGQAGPARLEGDDNLLPLVRTEVSGGQLVVSMAAEDGGSLSVETDHSLSLRLPVENLQRLQTHGSVKARAASGLRTPSFALEAHGSSSIELQVDCDELEQAVQGSATTKLRGRATSHSVRASGSSEVHAFDVVSESCEVRASGNSEVEVQVTGRLEARASGGAKITHRGNPQVSQSTTGNSVVERA